VANAVYPKAKEGFLDGSIDLDTASVKVALVRGYTYSSTHEFVSDVTGASGTLHATSAALTSIDVINGVFDAADVTFTTPATDANQHSLLIFQSSAVGGGADVATSSQRVIAWIDTGTGVPIVPAGGDITVVWDNGANKIFSL
jgi:hypothetical protein